MMARDGAQRQRVMYHKGAFLAYDVVVDASSPTSAPDDLRLSAGAVRALPLLHAAGYQIVVFSNETGVAHGRYTERLIEERAMRLHDLIADAAAPMAAFHYCPHDARGTETIYAFDCDCRLPEPGMLLRAQAELRINAAASWVIGNRLDDIEAAHGARIRGMLVDDGAELEWRADGLRRPDFIATDVAEAAVVIATSTRGGIRA